VKALSGADALLLPKSIRGRNAIVAADGRSLSEAIVCGQ